MTDNIDMDLDVNKLTDEIVKLKEKLKNKNERIKEINIYNKDLIDQIESDYIYKYIAHIRFKLAEKLTSHLDIGVYDVKFKYDNKIYVEKNLESESIKCIKLNLMISLAEKQSLRMSEYAIDILDIKKLW